MTIRTVESPPVRHAELDYDPALSAALERIEEATGHILTGQHVVWHLAKKDPALGPLAVQLSGVLGTLKARRRELEEEAGL